MCKIYLLLTMFHQREWKNYFKVGKLVKYIKNHQIIAFKMVVWVSLLIQAKNLYRVYWRVSEWKSYPLYKYPTIIMWTRCRVISGILVQILRKHALIKFVLKLMPRRHEAKSTKSGPKSAFIWWKFNQLCQLYGSTLGITISSRTICVIFHDIEQGQLINT